MSTLISMVLSSCSLKALCAPYYGNCFLFSHNDKRRTLARVKRGTDAGCDIGFVFATLV